MTLPLLQELTDMVIFMVMGCLAILFYFVYPPFWIIPATAFIYIFLFSPVISDSCFGFYVGPCRYDRWIHGANEWYRLKRK